MRDPDVVLAQCDERGIMLTVKEREVVRLRLTPKDGTFAEPMPFYLIGEKLDVTEGTAKQYWKRAKTKIKRDAGTPELRALISSEPTPGAGIMSEYQDPEKFAAVLEHITSPFMRSVAEVARAEGLPVQTAQAIIDRLEKQYSATKVAAQGSTVEELKRLTAGNARGILESITLRDIERANLRDKAVSAAILIDKSQLLDGKPTQILGTNERSHLETLATRMLAEMERRGMEVNVDPVSARVMVDDYENLPEEYRVGRKRLTTGSSDDERRLAEPRS